MLRSILASRYKRVIRGAWAARRALETRNSGIASASFAAHRGGDRLLACDDRWAAACIRRT